jgi:hypothetical protein
VPQEASVEHDQTISIDVESISPQLVPPQPYPENYNGYDFVSVLNSNSLSKQVQVGAFFIIFSDF